MRVSFNMMSRRVLENMTTNAERLLEAQTKSSSGKRILKPSDDVSGTGRALKLRSSVAEIEQHLQNSETIHSELSVATTALDSVVSKMQRVRVIALEAANSATSAESRTALIAELDQISASLVASGNTQFGDKRLFAGSKTNTTPFAPSGSPTPPYSYIGDSARMVMQVSPWTTVQSNVPGNQIFNIGGTTVPSAPDVFSTIVSLKNDIATGDLPAASQRVTSIDANLKNIVAIRSEVGGRLATLEAANDTLLDSKTTLNTLLSKTEDADLAESILQLQTRENMYQAAVSTAQRVLNLSLTEYFK